MTYHAILLAEELVDVLFDQDVRLHQHEAIGNHLPQLLHRHDVLGRTPHARLVDAYRRIAVGVLSEELVEIDHLPLRVVDYLHTLHPFREWACLDLLAVGQCQRGGVVKHHHSVLLTAMLAQTLDACLGQFRRVEVNNNNCFLFHIFLGLVKFQTLSASRGRCPRFHS